METGKEKIALGFIAGAVMTVATIVLLFGVGNGIQEKAVGLSALAIYFFFGCVLGLESKKNKIHYISYMKGYREGKSERENSQKKKEEKNLGKDGYSFYTETIKRVQEGDREEKQRRGR